MTVNKLSSRTKAEDLQFLTDLKQQVKDGLITQKEADKQARKIMAS
jgi:hypothetical protein